MELQGAIAGFLFHCQYEKNLSPKTLKAYSIDLRQFKEFLVCELQLTALEKIDKVPLRAYIKSLFGQLKEKSIKRKIATLKAFFRHLEREDEIPISPFRKMDVRIKEARKLPRTVSIEDLSKIFRQLYAEGEGCADRDSRFYREVVRDTALIEILFATGARVAEVCNLRNEDLDLVKGSVLIQGKGGRERVVYLCNTEAIAAVKAHYSLNNHASPSSCHFFCNRLGCRLSEHSVRSILARRALNAGVTAYIRPHSLRHSVATLLLEEGVDIRYIQNLLGHSSLATTQIYTAVRSDQARALIADRHPRRHFTLLPQEPRKPLRKL